jgi:hypothetical protein
MSLLGASTNEILFSAVLVALTLLGTYVGDFSEAIQKSLSRKS